MMDYAAWKTSTPGDIPQSGKSSGSSDQTHEPVAAAGPTDSGGSQLCVSRLRSESRHKTSARAADFTGLAAS